MSWKHFFWTVFLSLCVSGCVSVNELAVVGDSTHLESEKNLEKTELLPEEILVVSLFRPIKPYQWQRRNDGSWFVTSHGQNPEFVIVVAIEEMFWGSQFYGADMSDVEITQISRCEDAAQYRKITWQLMSDTGTKKECDGSRKSFDIPKSYGNFLDPLPGRASRLKKELAVVKYNLLEL